MKWSSSASPTFTRSRGSSAWQPRDLGIACAFWNPLQKPRWDWPSALHLPSWPPKQSSGDGTAGKWWWGWWGRNSTDILILKWEADPITLPSLESYTVECEELIVPIFKCSAAHGGDALRSLSVFREKMLLLCPKQDAFVMPQTPSLLLIPGNLSVFSLLPAIILLPQRFMGPWACVSQQAHHFQLWLCWDGCNCLLWPRGREERLLWSPPVWRHVVLSLLSETYLPPFSFALYFSQTVCQVALCAPYAHSTLQSWKDLYISQGFLEKQKQ